MGYVFWLMLTMLASYTTFPAIATSFARKIILVDHYVLHVEKQHGYYPVWISM